MSLSYKSSGINIRHWIVRITRERRLSVVPSLYCPLLGGRKPHWEELLTADRRACVVPKGDGKGKAAMVENR